MTQNIQTYLSGLINKNHLRYLDISTPSSVSTCSHCNKKTWQEPAPQLTGEIEDLKEFKELKSINAGNAKLTKLDGLFTLPNKEKLQKINFYGNKIKEVDFAVLLTNFPNLQSLSLDNNPVSAVNLNKLSKEQLKKLIEKIKSKQFRVCPYKGTVLQDLLHYLQSQSGSWFGGYAKEVESIIQSIPKKPSETNPKPASLVSILLAIAVISLLGFMLLIGYWLGKRKNNHEWGET